MRKHRCKGLTKTISCNICGDGYDAEERAGQIFEKAKKLINKAYEQGKADGKNEERKKTIDECISEINAEFCENNEKLVPIRVVKRLIKLKTVERK